MSAEIKIEDLLFDIENPRYENQTSQRETLQKIVSVQGEKLLVLAEDIVNQGLNPADRMIVIESEKENGKYTALEGNRRLAALKLLSNPSLLDSLSIKPNLKRKFQNIINKFNRDVIEPIDCALCESREEADHWRKLRHTGENDGAGVVLWDGYATARFLGKNISLQAIDFVEKCDELGKNIKGKKEAFPITNLGRLLGDPYVRGVLGLGIKEGKLWTELPQEEVIKGLKKITTDIGNKTITVSDIKGKDQRKEYIDKLNKSERPDFGKKISPWYIESAEKVQGKLFKSKRRLRQSTERKTLIPPSCILQIEDPRINTIYKELRKLKVETFPNAVAVLMRVFLELTVDHYITQKKVPLIKKNKSVKLDDAKLRTKVTAVAQNLIQSGVPKNDLKPIRAAVSNESSPFSIDTLHLYVHNKFKQPKPKDLLIDWDNARIFFEKMWE